MLTMFSVLSSASVVMSAVQCLAQEKIWFDKSKYDEAERRFYEGTNGVPSAPQVPHCTQAKRRKLLRLGSVASSSLIFIRPEPYVNPA